MKSPRLLALEAELAHVKAEIEALTRPKKKVRNLMTAKEIEIDADTPACCDPSTERYWSM